MGRKNLLVVDAVTGKPLASMGVKPILSYGYTGEGYYVSTSSEIKLLSLGTITSSKLRYHPKMWFNGTGLCTTAMENIWWALWFINSQTQ